jgi:hypothetical protein
MGVINLKLLSHPINWVTVFLMLILAGVAGHLVLSWVGIEPATANGGNGAPVSSGLVSSSQTTTAIGNAGGVTKPVVMYSDANSDGYNG